jgi:mono/diheme cytochrome c family protein
MRLTSLLKHAAVSSLLCISTLVAQADSDRNRVATPPLYQKECAACHLAYPPGLLPASSWQRLMGSLQQHFGTDASLDASSTREIGTWLQVNAGTYKRVNEAPPQDRITMSAWFLRKHNEREVPIAVWSRPAVGRASNCVACHSQAAQGGFSEHDIRIPR